MKRREFLQFLGLSAVGTALPSFATEELVARAPAFGVKTFMRFACPPLVAGKYTFSAHARKNGEAWGLFVSGFESKGGETIIEIPHESGLDLQWAMYGDPITVPLPPNFSEGYEINLVQIERHGTEASYLSTTKESQ